MRSAIAAVLMACLSIGLARPDTTPAQEAVTLRLRPPEGHVTRHRLETETWITGGPMAAMLDPSQPINRTTLFQTSTVNSVAGDTMTVTEVVDSATMEMPALPQMGGQLAQVAAQMRGMTTVQRFTSRGRLISSQTTGGPDPARARGGMGGMMGGGGGGGGNAQMQRTNMILPERPVRPGDSWADTVQLGGPNEPGAGTIVATFRLERLERRGGASVAVISLNGRMSATGPSTMNMRMTGSIELDLSASRMVLYTMDMDGNVSTPAGEMPMRMRVVSRAM